MRRSLRRQRLNLIYFVIAIWGVILLRNFWVTQQTVSFIAYDEFQTALEKGQIEKVFITDNHLRGRYKEGAPVPKKEFITARVEPELVETLARYGVSYERVIENNFFRDLLGWILPFVLFFGIWWFFVRRMVRPDLNSGFMTIGKSKAKIYVQTDTQVTFNDVAGIDEAKEELKEIVNFLKSPKGYDRLGAKMPKGILLIGPPGTGKTLLARAVAGEAGVPFFSISGSEFVEMFVGVGAARVRDLFEQARQRAPCIIFIDELDALGKSRQNPFSGGHDEKEQTLNQLLVEMDGFDSNSGIVLLGATNRPEVLDPALLRAGRFDRQVLIDRPDKKGRLQILRVHSQKVKLEAQLDLERVAELTPGFSGADLANLVNEAAIVATRRNGEAVNLSDFTVALERVIAGLERRSRVLEPKERKVVAYHEMGHALVAASLPGVDPIHKISIIPRSVGALGYTLQRPTGDRYITTMQELKNKMCVLLGGRASEMLIFNHLSTGAADDLAKVTDIAKAMVTQYGMDEVLGSAVYAAEQSYFLRGVEAFSSARWNYADATSREVDLALRGLINEALATSLSVLRENAEILEEGAQRLLQRETLEEAELVDLFQRLKRSELSVSPGSNSGSRPREI